MSAVGQTETPQPLYSRFVGEISLLKILNENFEFGLLLRVQPAKVPASWTIT